MEKVLATTCMLEIQGEASLRTCALLQSISWQGDRQILCAPIHTYKATIYCCYSWQAFMQTLSPPLRYNCHCELRGGQTKTMTKDREWDCRDNWRNHTPRSRKRIEGYLQPTLSSTPQLTLITATLFRQMKVNRIWILCHHGEIVTVIPDLTRKSLVGLFGYFSSSAHTGWRTFLQPTRLLTHTNEAVHTGRMLEQEEAGGQQWRP